MLPFCLGTLNNVYRGRVIFRSGGPSSPGIDVEKLVVETGGRRGRNERQDSRVPCVSYTRDMILIVSDAITSFRQPVRTARSQASHLLCMIYRGVLSTCLRYTAVHISSFPVIAGSIMRIFKITCQLSVAGIRSGSVTPPRIKLNIGVTQLHEPERRRAARTSNV